MATKNGTAAKIAAAVVLALGIPAGGVIGFAKLQSDVEWACKRHTELEARHCHDIDRIQMQFNAMKLSLDEILQRSTANQATLSIVAQLLRDHVQDMKGGGE